MGTIWTQPSPSDFDRWEALLLAGQEPSTAAKSLGHTCSAFRRTDPTRHAELLELSREARGATADENGEKWALGEDASDQMRLAWLKRWNASWAGVAKVEFSGDAEKPVVFELSAGKLAEAAQILREARGDDGDESPVDPVHPA